MAVTNPRIKHVDPGKYLDYSEYYLATGHTVDYALVRSASYVVAASDATNAEKAANTIYIDDIRSIPAPSTELGNALDLGATEGIYDSRDTELASVVCNGQGATTGFLVLQPSANPAGMVGSMYVHFTGV